MLSMKVGTKDKNIQQYSKIQMGNDGYRNFALEMKSIRRNKKWYEEAKFFENNEERIFFTCETLMTTSKL